jgi:hypothetical protein
VSHEVEIEHLDSVYLVPPGHPEPQQVRWQLDRVARTRLDAALDRALAENFDAEEELVCVIDELEIDVALDVDAADEDALAAAWAQAIATAVRAAVDEPPGGGGVHVFASRADLLAAFLADLAEGRAWDRGCYSAFEGLRVLPSHATVGEALTRDPAVARAALAQLARERRLEGVLRALGARESERVAAALAAGGTATPAAVEVVLDVWPEVRGGPQRGRAPDAADALRLAALAAGEADPASVVAAARALVAIAGSHAAGEAVRAEALLQELVQHDLRLADRVEEVVSPAAAPPVPDGAFVGTAYAGVFLLLQGLLELDADRVLAALAPEESSVAQLRLALLVRCLGTPDAAADPGVHVAAGAEEESETKPGGDGWGPAQRLLLERLVRLGRAEGRRLLLERVDGENLVLVRDAERDTWLALLDAETAETQAVRLVTEVLERPPEAVEWSDEPCDLDGPPGTLGLLAHAVLRELAVRLPGLDRSSPAYLRENFLVGPGMIRVGGEMLEIQLPPSPLRIVLQLAGVHGRALTVPWLGEVVLRLPDP